MLVACFPISRTCACSILSRETPQAGCSAIVAQLFACTPPWIKQLRAPRLPVNFGSCEVIYIARPAGDGAIVFDPDFLPSNIYELRTVKFSSAEEGRPERELRMPRGHVASCCVAAG